MILLSMSYLNKFLIYKNIIILKFKTIKIIFLFIIEINFSIVIEKFTSSLNI
jgi:hypothetical protein